jgi:hypothetical protein
MDTIALLSRPISELGFTDDFIARSRQMGFEALSDIMVTDPGELVRKAGFSYHWLAELSTFLQARRLLHLLQPMPGKSSG